MFKIQRGRAARFPTTRWSLVDLIRQGDEHAARDALEELLGRYLPALFAHLVHGRGRTPDESEDLIQEFVASKVLQKDLITGANRELGKFRTYLLTALDRFLVDYLRHASAKKRSPGDAQLLTLGEQDEYLRSRCVASDAFDVAWARGVIAESLKRMRRHCEMSGRADLWGVFELRLVNPILNGSEPVDYEQLVRRFRLGSPAQASNVLITSKRMYARVLRAVVAEYTGDAEETESELRELKAILARSPR